MSKKTNKNPQFTAYLPPVVLEALRKEAQKQHRSMNAQLVWCLEQCLGGKMQLVEQTIIKQSDSRYEVIDGAAAHKRKQAVKRTLRL